MTRSETKRTLIFLAALLAMATPGNAGITAKFVDIENFTDFTISGGREARAKTAFEKELQRHGKLKKLVGTQRTLDLTFTDIDMAGETEPWRFRNNSDIRIIRGIYPPRMSFSYVLKDAKGNTLAAGTEKISDIGFDLHPRNSRSNDSFYFELKMLENWARKTLPPQ